MAVELEKLKELQEKLAQRLCLVPLKSKPRLVGGADVSYLPGDQKALGVVVVYDLETKEIKEIAFAKEKVTFPYIPGFLSFREVPVLKDAIHKLRFRPEVLLVDGQGILHPRRLGLAAHLGLELGLPTVGVAKKPLIGEFEPPPEKEGAFSLIEVNGEIRGAALRTRARVKPVYVSPGHLIDLPSALGVVKACLSGYRLPEPLRQAHLWTQRLKRDDCGNYSCRWSR